ncbi:TlpA disulfide reductase family protein [Modicisalibacter sp. 'Wilcox']|uniref:TlpA family protein disulfide reductase n=1 Tax=Modicisalibacter sp. 'Wilcox' TaxID=2679914 RepID=UPI0013D55D46|nr:TlpA disulfide reductase family protein [Modicisalibacter sp. 'Wilcox']
MNVLALGPWLVPLPRLYAGLIAGGVLIAATLVLRLPHHRRAIWFGGGLVCALLAARLGHAALHPEATLAAPLDLFRPWLPGYQPLAGWLGAAAWSAWALRDRRRPRLAAQGLLVAAALAWLGLTAWQPLGRAPTLTHLPDLALDTLEGRSVTLAPADDRPLIVTLVQTRCRACRHTLPRLAALAARGEARVAVIAEGDSLLAVGRYLDRHGLSLPRVLLDPHEKWLALSHAPGLPATLVFDRHGRRVASHAGEPTRALLDSWTRLAQR